MVETNLCNKRIKRATCRFQRSLYRKYRLLAGHCFEEDTDSLSISIYITTFFDVVWHKQILTYRQRFFSMKREISAKFKLCIPIFKNAHMQRNAHHIRVQYHISYQTSCVL